MPALMISERVSAVEKIIKYKFHDKSLLVEALECPGACICTPHQGNKRLALVGDAALRLTIFESEFGNDSTTGEMTKTHDAYAKNKNLAKLGVSLGLGTYIQQHTSTKGIGSGTMATTMEAIIGAVYLDCGNSSSLKEIMRRLILQLQIMPNLSTIR